MPRFSVPPPPVEPWGWPVIAALALLAFMAGLRWKYWTERGCDAAPGNLRDECRATYREPAHD